jgi:hypothetical protein
MKQTTVSIQENFTILSTEMNLFITDKSTLDASCKGRKARLLTAIPFFILDQNSIFDLTKAEMFSRFFILIFTSKKNINFIKRSKMPLSVYFRFLSCLIVFCDNKFRAQMKLLRLICFLFSAITGTYFWGFFNQSWKPLICSPDNTFSFIYPNTCRPNSKSLSEPQQETLKSAAKFRYV